MAVVNTFACFFDATKSTSGQRFFAALVDALGPQGTTDLSDADTLLFNVSAPLGQLIRARLRGQSIVLRLDGIYHDRLSTPFIASFRSAALRWLFRSGLRFGVCVAPLTRLANLLNRNYGAVARALLAHRVVYQSDFCRRSWRVYLARKPATIIVNGFHWSGHASASPGMPADRVELVTAYDDWKPAKRIDELVDFVHWVNEEGRVPVRLTLVGFTGAFPDTYSQRTRDLIRGSAYLRTTPRFGTIDTTVREVYCTSHVYITFTYRDPCPNVVVEAMAFGLPVVATRSGGLPDIVGDAGQLVSLAENAEPEFCASRYESDFPRIDPHAVLGAVQTVVANLDEYRHRVRARFAADLEIGVVARRYADFLR